MYTYTLPPIGIEPDVRGGPGRQFLLKGLPVRFHVKLGGCSQNCISKHLSLSLSLFSESLGVFARGSGVRGSEVVRGKGGMGRFPGGGTRVSRVSSGRETGTRDLMRGMGSGHDLLWKLLSQQVKAMSSLPTDCLRSSSGSALDNSKALPPGLRLPGFYIWGVLKTAPYKHTSKASSPRVHG